MDLKCSTCKVTLHGSSGYPLNLEIPELKSKLILMVQECLYGSTVNLQESELICNGCKVQFILFYQFKTKTTKLLDEKQNDSLKVKDIIVKFEVDAKPNLKRSNSDEPLSQRQKKRKPNSPEKAATKDSVMKYKCLTCNKSLDESSANHMNLDFPNLEKDVIDRFREVDKDKDLNLKYIIEKCLFIKVQNSRVICDICKDGFIASYKFNMKSKKTVVERGYDNDDFKILEQCKLCGEINEGSDWDDADFQEYHVYEEHRGELFREDNDYTDYVY